MKALVTGGSGYIGTRLVRALQQRGDNVTVVTRRADADVLPGVERRVADLTQPETLKGLCAGADVVFHLAGYAHADDANELSAASIHQRITIDGTRALLEDVKNAGVKRFIFVSSTKAIGEGGAECLDEASVAQPTTAYGRAKLAAEKLVLDAGNDELEVCILRLPLVYGDGSKGNIARMIAAVDHGGFPPVPDIPNKRSMAYIGDVVEVLLLLSQRQQVVGRTYIVTDGKFYSTRQLYISICHALGKPVPRWSIPLVALKCGAAIGDVITRLGLKSFPLTGAVLEKLIGSAWYSSALLQRELGFRPTGSFDAALPEMIARYREKDRRVD